MNSGVRVVKRGKDDGSKRPPVGRDEKRAKFCEREIASTVKGWIAELEKRYASGGSGGVGYVPPYHD